MSRTTILHNPRCSTSRGVVEIAAHVGADVEVRFYLEEPLTEAELHDLVGKLEDPVGKLVRRDPQFVGLGLDIDHVDDVDSVIETLLAHPQLLQRPILIRDGRAIVGRPRERAKAFLQGRDVRA